MWEFRFATPVPQVDMRCARDMHPKCTRVTPGPLPRGERHLRRVDWRFTKSSGLHFVNSRIWHRASKRHKRCCEIASNFCGWPCHRRIGKRRSAAAASRNSNYWATSPRNSLVDPRQSAKLGSGDFLAPIVQVRLHCAKSTHYQHGWLG